MTSINANLVKALDGVAPQYKKEGEQIFEAVEGSDGALHTKIKGDVRDSVKEINEAMQQINKDPITGIKRVPSNPIEISVTENSMKGRGKLIIKNEDAILRVRIGENKDDLQQTGFPLEPGASAEFKFRRGSNIPIYAVSEGAAVDIAVMEV